MYKPVFPVLCEIKIIQSPLCLYALFPPDIDVILSLRRYVASPVVTCEATPKAFQWHQRDRGRGKGFLCLFLEKTRQVFCSSKLSYFLVCVPIRWPVSSFLFLCFLTHPEAHKQWKTSVHSLIKFKLKKKKKKKNLDYIILSEVIQSQKNTHGIHSLISGY